MSLSDRYEYYPTISQKNNDDFIFKGRIFTDNSNIINLKLHRKLSLKIFWIYFFIFNVPFFMLIILLSHPEYGIITNYKPEIFIPFYIFLCLIIGTECGFLVINRLKQSLKIIQNNVCDTKWNVIVRDKLYFKRPPYQVHEILISSLSSFHWNILYEKKYYKGVPIFVKIIGVTNLGLFLNPDIFIICVCKNERGYTTVDCSIRPHSNASELGSYRCKKRLEKLMNCLSSCEDIRY
ncbi:MAG: hypothetical protein JSW00_01390 [Thermoplasmata archaeon]|nr:MAG: hypothetical protein JSW00_01390 [Thermoplasmata archaeon]